MSKSESGREITVLSDDPDWAMSVGDTDHTLGTAALKKMCNASLRQQNPIRQWKFIIWLRKHQILYNLYQISHVQYIYANS